MKEYQVPGLMELKARYEKRLSRNKEYGALSEEFHTKALALVQKQLKSKKIDLSKAPILEASAKAGLASASCGFCTNCITDCRTCVFGAPRTT